MIVNKKEAKTVKKQDWKLGLCLALIAVCIGCHVVSGRNSDSVVVK